MRDDEYLVPCASVRPNDAADDSSARRRGAINNRRRGSASTGRYRERRGRKRG